MHLRSLYWIIAASSLLVVTAVLTAPISDADMYVENMLKEKGFAFINQTKDGIYQEEKASIDPLAGVIKVEGLYRTEGKRDQLYNYLLIPGGDGYRLVEPSLSPIPGQGLAVQVEPKLIFCLLGGGKF